MAKKILIIEDQAQLRYLIAFALRYMNYEPLEAEDGYAGIQTSLAEHPDLVLLDLSLPGMSGIDTAKKLKENPRTGQIPIIALTGWEPRQFEAKARQVGMAAYLQKPVSLATIIERIESLTSPDTSQLSKSIHGRALSLAKVPS
jgi:two-component system phosphate regulon response regulator PhoB